MIAAYFLVAALMQPALSPERPALRPRASRLHPSLPCKSVDCKHVQTFSVLCPKLCMPFKQAMRGAALTSSNMVTSIGNDPAGDTELAVYCCKKNRPTGDSPRNSPDHTSCDIAGQQTPRQQHEWYALPYTQIQRIQISIISNDDTCKRN